MCFEFFICFFVLVFSFFNLHAVFSFHVFPLIFFLFYAFSLVDNTALIPPPGTTTQGTRPVVCIPNQTLTPSSFLRSQVTLSSSSLPLFPQIGEKRLLLEQGFLSSLLSAYETRSVFLSINVEFSSFVFFYPFSQIRFNDFSNTQNLISSKL